MNSLERLENRLNGFSVDYVPNLTIVMMFAARQIQVPYGAYVSDYRLLAKAAMLCHEKFGIDCLCAISDPMREAEGFGAKVVVPEDGIPYSPEKRINEISQISGLKPIAPERSPRMNDRLEAVRLMREQSGGKIPVIGWVEGPFAECCDLMDMQEVMMYLYDEPYAVKELLEICLEQAVLFATAQIKAGAHIIGIGDAAASLVGPDLYREFALEYEQRLIAAIHRMGAKCKLHICGNITPILGDIAQTKADIVDCDHMVDLQLAGRMLPGACISGNINPVLLLNSRKAVEHEVNDCLTAGNERHILAAGCEIPKMTPEENLLALHSGILTYAGKI